jgi:uncharacterized iron-regulated membrane protein
MRFQNPKLQTALRSLHLWVGLIAGIFIVMMGLTGMISVFHPVVETSMAPRIHAEAPSSGLTAMQHSFAAAHPGARIMRVTIPENPAGLLLVQAETRDKKHLDIYFEAASGRELGTRRTLAWLDWIVDLHQNLLMGKAGRALTGVIGIALLFTALSGLFSWLAGPRDWRRAIALPPKGPWRRTNYQLHQWAGLWGNLLLLAVSLTGIVLAYPDSFQQAVRLVTGERRLPQRDRMVNASPGVVGDVLPLDDYVRAAVAAVPGGVVRELRMPSRGLRAVSVSLWTPGDIRPKGGNVVLLSRAPVHVLAVERSSDAPLSRKLVEFANALHKTELGGLPVKLAWSLLGLVPFLLFVSGLQIWWSRKQSARRYSQHVQENTAKQMLAAARK